MPIDYSKYPDNWKTEIRPSILKRAENKCEFCGIENYIQGYRDLEGNFYSGKYLLEQLEIGNDLFDTKLSHIPGDKKPIKIVLTIAHLEDPDPMNCNPDNLAALCQRCHLNYDRKRNNKKRKEEKHKDKYKLF